MIIVIVEFDVAATDRPVALAHLHALREAACVMPGNLAYRVHASRENETGITLVQEWQDEEAFSGYQTSDAFVASGPVLRPLMTGVPVSRRFRAELLETVA
ncbi:antibiotic biosynthesis monooxygenase [Kineosporia rhizophila]|uniref:putative quinol monooxygenase n=1 Tax=Kineosporia TaxID=49184 RepID=UPI001E2EDFA9|nr:MULTISPECIES: antibiotic biosynthesis monooxygenase [Kineosporia]MCE0535385.1 antibiotic biosynthesis monooxygenase [Kineosporia rhizophila]GLY16834.1 hypothetical protein Kisp01_38490 [Kineosporia sp. NBRC 101677]